MEEASLRIEGKPPRGAPSRARCRQPAFSLPRPRAPCPAASASRAPSSACRAHSSASPAHSSASPAPASARVFPAEPSGTEPVSAHGVPARRADERCRRAYSICPIPVRAGRCRKFGDAVRGAAGRTGEDCRSGTLHIEVVVALGGSGALHHGAA